MVCKRVSGRRNRRTQIEFPVHLEAMRPSAEPLPLAIELALPGTADGRGRDREAGQTPSWRDGTAEHSGGCVIEIDLA